MNKDKLDAIPDDVWVEAYDAAYPEDAHLDSGEKIRWAKLAQTIKPIARLIMQVRALKAQLPEQVDPDLLAARKIAADRPEVKGTLIGAGMEAGKHDDHPYVECALAGIKHGREQSQ